MLVGMGTANSAQRPTVLILGAGINGAAVARELVLNGVSVCVVDRNDIAFGASARSSRLIHGGLRYLEYGDFRLVRESLQERKLLCRLAPQYVKPLRLFIPVQNRFGGAVRSALRFLRLSGTWIDRLAAGRKSCRSGSRGLWLVRLGLWLYDRFACDESFPKHGVCQVGSEDAPRVNPARYRWLCNYWDAQIVAPERFVLALLEDARQAALANDVDFEVRTYHQAAIDGATVTLRRVSDANAPTDCSDSAQSAFQPAMIINATGAWGDLALEQLQIPSKRLFRGTKGSHIFTRKPELRESIGSDGVYAEADDGRLVFILPMDDGVMVGTTDEVFEDDPASAIATDRELDYLIELANDVLADVELSRADVDWHYSGVRPLPYVPTSATGSSAASIPRGHWIERNDSGQIPIVTLIGGKLTTCRSLAEEVTDLVLNQLQTPRSTTTRNRPVPGADGYPATEQEFETIRIQLADSHGLTHSQINAMWRLVGNRIGAIFGAIFDTVDANRGDRGDSSCDDISSLSGTGLPRMFVRWVIENEWVETLGDLVERRLLLVGNAGLSEACLRELAQCLVDANRLRPGDIDSAITDCCTRLQRFYGKQVIDSEETHADVEGEE